MSNAGSRACYTHDSKRTVTFRVCFPGLSHNHHLWALNTHFTLVSVWPHCLAVLLAQWGMPRLFSKEFNKLTQNKVAWTWHRFTHTVSCQRSLSACCFHIYEKKIPGTTRWMEVQLCLEKQAGERMRQHHRPRWKSLEIPQLTRSRKQKFVIKKKNIRKIILFKSSRLE